MVALRLTRKFASPLQAFIQNRGSQHGPVNAFYCFLFIYLVRTILLALRDHFVTEDKTAIGYLGYTAEARADLAKKSLHWRCSKCGYGRPPSASSSESSINKCASQEAFSQEPSTALPNSSAYVNFGSLLIFLLAVAIGYYCFLESNFMK